MSYSNFSLVSVLYLFSIYFFFNFSSLIIYWIFLEINLLCFVILYNESNFFYFIPLDSILYYFLIQSFSSLTFLIFSLSVNPINPSLTEMFMILLIMFKMGLFPFYFWQFKLSEVFSTLMIFFLVTFNKIPLFIMILYFNSNISFYILIMSLISGSYFLYFSKSINSLIISSSLYFTIWLYLCANLSFNFFMFFLCIYFTFTFFMLNFSKFSSSSSSSIISFSSLIFFLNLPPFGMFFFKFFLFYGIMVFLPIFIFLIIWIFSFLSLVGYFKFFYSVFFSYFKLYSHQSLFLEFSLFIFSMLISFMFLF